MFLRTELHKIYRSTYDFLYDQDFRSWFKETYHSDFGRISPKDKTNMNFLEEYYGSLKKKYVIIQEPQTEIYRVYRIAKKVRSDKGKPRKGKERELAKFSGTL